MRQCFLCGRNGTGDPLDRHHIFGGALRGKSERYGLTVDLCHDRCHENGPRAAHRCRETREYLSRYGQEKVMREQGWTEEDFIREFGRSWLHTEVVEVVAVAPPFAFAALDIELPY